MSYNVTHWTTKELKDFSFPMEAFHERWLDDPRITKDGILIMGSVEGMEIEGDLIDDDRLNVTEISYYGTGSGVKFDKFQELLKQSKGTLKSGLVWESGNLQRMSVIDGIVEITYVEL